MVQIAQIEFADRVYTIQYLLKLVECYKLCSSVKLQRGHK